MCRESITIAQCAPHNPPVLTFNCGKMHMVAQDRLVCDSARGTCVCFFGTCGSVVRDVTTSGIDLADIAKVRCASCTVREDAVGDRRKGQEILESVLLERPAVGKSDLEKHSARLTELWRNKSGCPYHTKALAETETVTGTEFEPVGHHASPKVDAHPVVESTTIEPDVAQPVSSEPELTGLGTTEPALSESAITEPETTEPEPAVTEPAVTEPAVTEPAAVDEWITGTSPPSNHEDEQACEPSFDSGIKNGLECDVGLNTSRWASTKSPEPSTQEESVAPGPRRVPTVNFMFDPNNAEKLREATQKFATLKSSFLAGNLTA
ncbi:hypothetical protein FSARC_5964 [Fusarium sarcochroum]|uniref:Uncharacterized protein n=1 Tax=Fusarium sarcochroum TaxID=1208366 RepID=A0A8H4TY84_9HYPO|nr:hypothetical protein FSARC_5964 [Fusarium sarcochroum]